MKFREVENLYTEEMKKELLEGFRNAEEFAYMKGYEPWERLINERPNPPAMPNIINLRKKWKGICSQVPFIVLKYRQGCI